MLVSVNNQTNWVLRLQIFVKEIFKSRVPEDMALLLYELFTVLIDHYKFDWLFELCIDLLFALYL